MMKIAKSSLFITTLSIMLASLDQIIKYLVVVFLQGRVELLPFISISLEKNSGIAWSIPIPPIILIPLSLILLVIIPYLAVTSLNLEKKLSQIALCLLIGGGAGNVIDRILHGYVVDYISVGLWPVFNLADAFLTIGIFIILIFYAKIKRT